MNGKEKKKEPQQKGKEGEGYIHLFSHTYRRHCTGTWAHLYTSHTTPRCSGHTNRNQTRKQSRLTQETANLRQRCQFFRLMAAAYSAYVSPNWQW